MSNRSLAPSVFSRRSMLGMLGAAGGALALGGGIAPLADAVQKSAAVPSFTGPGANPYWNSVGAYVSEPQKGAMLLLTDRP
ncbi:MAG: hypothetical protein ACRD52_10340, partial [Candidatus Acidiferrales bacterium]